MTANKRTIVMGVIACALMLPAHSVRATTPVEVDKLLASDEEQFEEFGESMPISTDKAMFGSNDNTDGSATNAVYIFVRTGLSWTEQAKSAVPGGSGFRPTPLDDPLTDAKYQALLADANQRFPDFARITAALPFPWDAHYLRPKVSAMIADCA